MKFRELMIESLSALLEDGENLRYPVYGTLKQKNNHWFGFFGLTERYLLISLLQGSSKKIIWSARIPLHIKKVTIKKSLFPLLYNVNIEFSEGEPAHIVISKKVYGIKSQEKYYKGFIDYIQTRYIPI